ncbi:MAG: nucleoside phosphorylase, partial [Rhizobiales bacterium]|nr:nucleoside phosphorylase [Hyphomicrobiales bacterium]
MGHVGIITGLAFEAALVSKVCKKMNWGAGAPEVRCVGMGGSGARSAAEALAGGGVSGLVSFGIAGGLDPSLAAGTLVVPEQVVTGQGQVWPVDAAWHTEVLAALDGTLDVAGGTVLAGAGMLTTAAAKQAAWRETGAAAADMESAEIAAAAQDVGLRFLVVRAVADEAGMALPPAAASMGPGGELRLGAVAGSILRQPGQVPGLVRLGLKTQKACA